MRDAKNQDPSDTSKIDSDVGAVAISSEVPCFSCVFGAGCLLQGMIVGGKGANG